MVDISGQGEVRNGQRIMHSNAGDQELMVEFYIDPVDDVEKCKIGIPGDSKFQPVFVASETWQDGITYAERFSLQYADFKADKEQLAGQTRLSDVPWLDQGMIDGLRGKSIRTVEQLAAVTDGNLDKIGLGARGLRQKAIDHVEQAEKAAAFDEQSEKFKALEEQNRALEARLAALEAPAKAPTAKQSAASKGKKL